MGDYPDGLSARQEIGGYIRRYCTERPHQALWNFTPQFVHDLNDKTELLRRLKELKRQTLERRRQYWLTRQDPLPSGLERELVKTPILSQ